jgi:hypothetical protein
VRLLDTTELLWTVDENVPDSAPLLRLDRHWQPNRRSYPAPTDAMLAGVPVQSELIWELAELVDEPVASTLRNCLEAGRTTLPARLSLALDPFHSRRKPLAAPTTKVHGESDQKKHDSNDADDVRYPGKRPCDVAGIRPDEANGRSHDEQSDHCG